MVSFEIRPPIWATWWFRVCAAAAVAGAAFALHRLRLSKAIAVERIRHRIAKDLHDDVGATLCHAALLSDLVHRENVVQSAVGRERLEQISSVCREALESMSDIIWAVDPQKDRVGDLVQRMRRFGEEMLGSSGVELRFANSSASDALLMPQLRHQVFLIYKEAIHNVVRHSSATWVEVQISASSHDLTLRIADNGCGLPSHVNPRGNGLQSMRERVSVLGGAIRIDTHVAPYGTVLDFAFPLKPTASNGRMNASRSPK